MFTFKIFVFTILLMNFELIELDALEWESPLDGFFSREATHMKEFDEEPTSDLELPTKKAGNTGRVQSMVPKVYHDSNSACSSFFPRFVNVLLKAIDVKPDTLDGYETKTITIDVHLSQKALEVLQKFGSGGDIAYDELDNSFISLFNPNDGYMSNFKRNVGDYILGWFSLSFDDIPTFTLMSAILLVSVLIYFILKKLNACSLVGLIFFIYYGLSLGSDLFSQYQDLYDRRILALEETLSMEGGGGHKIPDACFPSKMKFMDKLYNYFSDNPCNRNLQMKKSIWSEIDFLQAFSKPVFGLLFSFLPELGDKAGKSVKNFSDHFWFPFNWILAILLTFCGCSFLLPSIISMLFVGPSNLNPSVFWRKSIDQRETEPDTDSRSQVQPVPNSAGLMGGSSGNVVVNYHLHPFGHGSYGGNNMEPSSTFPKLNWPTKAIKGITKPTFNNKRKSFWAAKKKKTEKGQNSAKKNEPLENSTKKTD